VSRDGDAAASICDAAAAAAAGDTLRYMELGAHAEDGAPLPRWFMLRVPSPVAPRVGADSDGVG